MWGRGRGRDKAGPVSKKEVTGCKEEEGVGARLEGAKKKEGTGWKEEEGDVTRTWKE
jgi:hypothetical protein